MAMQFNRHQWLGRASAAAVVAFLLVACAGLRIPVEPSICLSPTSGGPGTRVLVTGSDFPADTVLAVRLGPPDVGATPQTYGQATSDAGGRLQLAFDMPARWPDGSPVTEEELVVVVLNEDGSVKAVAPFRFEPAAAAIPTLTLDPGTGAHGQQIDVSGRGFPPRCELSLQIGRATAGIDPLPLARTTTGEAGGFDLLITIPSTWPTSGAPLLEDDLILLAINPDQEVLATARLYLQPGS
jgi:hypothetical protein